MKPNDLFEEFKKDQHNKGKKPVKPFASLQEIFNLLEEEIFQRMLEEDERFLFFIRKKLFFTVNKNEDLPTLKGDFKLLSSISPSLVITVISDQILLTYFQEDLTTIDLLSIILRVDEYNALTAYKIKSDREAQRSAVSN